MQYTLQKEKTIRLDLSEEEAFVIYRMRTGERYDNIIRFFSEPPLENDDEARKWLSSNYIIDKLETEKNYNVSMYVSRCKKRKQSPNIKTIHRIEKTYDDNISAEYEKAIQKQRDRETAYENFTEWVQKLNRIHLV